MYEKAAEAFSDGGACRVPTSVCSDSLELLDQLGKVFLLVEVKPLVLHPVPEVTVSARGKAGGEDGKNGAFEKRRVKGRASKERDHSFCRVGEQLIRLLVFLSFLRCA